MRFAQQRQINPATRKGSLLETFGGFGFGDYSGRGGLLSALPVGARSIIGAILNQRSSTPRARLPPVVISEIPRTILPQDSARGAISKEDLLGEGWPEWSTEPILETRPGRTPDPYPGTEAAAGTIAERVVGRPDEEGPTRRQNDLEEGEMAGWTDWIGWGIDVLQGQAGGPGTGYATPGILPGTDSYSQMMYGGDGGPGKVTVDTRTGKVTKCGRRRRRRLLTESDFNDLMRIATLPNNANVRTALAKSIGRR